MIIPGWRSLESFWAGATGPIGNASGAGRILVSVELMQVDWLAHRAVPEPVTRVLVADHDPISSHVLGALVRAAPQLHLTGCVDGRTPVSEWPLAGVHLVLLSVGPEEQIARLVHGPAGRGARVLVLGTGWTRPRLDAAFQAGAGGCLVKDRLLIGLEASIRAVAAGQRTLSPSLLDLYLMTSAVVLAEDRDAGGDPPARVRDEAEGMLLLALLTTREREVLDLLAEGASTAEVAERLVVSPSTVKSHISHALSKLGVRNRLEAVLLIRGRPDRLGMLPPVA